MENKRWKITTDQPENNVDTMNNIAFDRNGECMMRNAGENGEDVSLIAFTHRICKEFGICPERHYLQPEDMDAFGEEMLACSMEGCPIGTMYYALIGAVECRARLEEYEKSNVTPEELAQIISSGVVPQGIQPLKTVGVVIME